MPGAVPECGEKARYGPWTCRLGKNHRERCHFDPEGVAHPSSKTEKRGVHFCATEEDASEEWRPGDDDVDVWPPPQEEPCTPA